jgi:hypothetical protein
MLAKAQKISQIVNLASTSGSKETTTTAAL